MNKQCPHHTLNAMSHMRSVLLSHLTPTPFLTVQNVNNPAIDGQYDCMFLVAFVNFLH